MKLRKGLVLPPGAPLLTEGDVGEVWDCKDTGEIRMHTEQRGMSYCTLIFKYTYVSRWRDPRSPTSRCVRHVDVESDPFYITHNQEEAWMTSEGVNGLLIAEVVCAAHEKARETIARAIRNNPERVGLLHRARMKAEIVTTLDQTED